MSQELLRIRKLSAAYGDTEVLSEISVGMTAGEILCIVGESGSGKSTLLKAVHGMSKLAVTGGEIVYDGREMSRLSGRERRYLMGAEIALIPQDPGASFNPVRKYAAQFKEALAGHGRSYREDEITELLGSIGLEEGAKLLRSKPYELSGGMNQRIAIAAAMMFRPRLLLCDEATSALDVTTAGIVVDELMKIRDRDGTAIFMVTHHLGIARLMADNIAIMKSGRLIEYGSREKIFSTPENEYTARLIRDVPRLKK